VRYVTPILSPTYNMRCTGGFTTAILRFTGQLRKPSWRSTYHASLSGHSEVPVAKVPGRHVAMLLPHQRLLHIGAVVFGRRITSVYSECATATETYRTHGTGTYRYEILKCKSQTSRIRGYSVQAFDFSSFLLDLQDEPPSTEDHRFCSMQYNPLRGPPRQVFRYFSMCSEQRNDRGTRCIKKAGHYAKVHQQSFAQRVSADGALHIAHISRS
jgi:hypothetical protein